MTKLTFKKEELERYPLLEKLEIGTEVLALKDSPYENLKGEIVELNYNKEDRVSENDCIIEIVVDFEEPSTNDRLTKYACLNGTSVENVVMTEEGEIAFLFDDANGYQLLTGQLVCEWCLNPLTSIEETQYDYIGWDWNPKTMSYIKREPSGDTNHKRCTQCDSRIETEFVEY